jgi:hypothetical protein
MKRHIKTFESFQPINEDRFREGDRVRLKPDYADVGSNEVFTLSQWDEEAQRGWIGDRDDRGWYVRGYQIEPVDDWDDDEWDSELDDDWDDELGDEGDDWDGSVGGT